MMEQAQLQSDTRAAATEATIATQLSAAQAAVEKAQQEADRRVAEAQAAMQVGTGQSAVAVAIR